MKKLFESVPTSTQVRQWLDAETQNVVEEFAKKVTASIQKLSSDSFTLQSSSEFNRMFHWIHWQKVRDTMEEKGWRVQLISDQRDGDYFKISMLGQSTWQPMTD